MTYLFSKSLLYNMPNAWISHLQAYRKAHPSVSYKDAMKLAKPSYKPSQIGIPNRAMHANPKVKTMPYLGGQQGKGSRLLTEPPVGTLNPYSNSSKIEKCKF
jgi:hypothetical protein